MGKALGLAGSSARFFFDYLQDEQFHGKSDREVKKHLDGTVADEFATSGPGVCKLGPKDGVLQSGEIFAHLFNNYSQHQDVVTAHFKKLGLDLSWLQPNGKASNDFVAQVKRNLAGQNPKQPEKSLLSLVKELELNPEDPRFAEKLVRGALRRTELSLLPLAEQKEVLSSLASQYPAHEKLVDQLHVQLKEQFKKYNTAPRLVAQAALLKGLEFEALASQIQESGEIEAATLLRKRAQLLFQAAVELDGENPLARRKLATYLYADPRRRAEAGAHLAKAVQYETSLDSIYQMAALLKKVDDRKLMGGKDVWSFIGGNLMEAKRFSEAATLFHHAAKESTKQGEFLISIRFTEQELLANEAAKPFVRLFTKESNPVATRIYEVLRSHGIPSELMDDGDRKISAEEVLKYIDENFSDPRVQAALRLKRLPWLDKKGNFKPEFNTPEFKALGFTRKVAAYRASKAQQTDDPKRAERHLQYAAHIEPDNATRFLELGNHFKAQKNYPKAIQAYHAAFALNPSDLSSKLPLGQAYFGNGDFKLARDSYTAVLEKNSRDVPALRFRKEANLYYLSELNKKLPKVQGEEKSELEKAKVASESELKADTVMLLALRADQEKEKLTEVGKQIQELPGSPLRQNLIEVLASTGTEYLSLANQSYADPKDMEFVTAQLNSLASATFKVLHQYAKQENDPAAPLYEGQGLMAEGKLDEAVKLFESIRATNPVAEEILTTLERDKLRMINLAAVEAWEVYNKEGEAILNDNCTGILGHGIGFIDSLVRSDGRTWDQDRADKWVSERELVAAIKEQISSGKAATMKEALEQIRSSGPEELKPHARFYLEHGERWSKGYPLGNLIDFTSKLPPDEELARIVLGKSFTLEYDNNAVEAPYALYSVVYAFSQDPAVREEARRHMDALEGNGNFGRSVAKFVFSMSPESLVFDVLLMFASAGLGNLAKLAMLAKLEKAGVTGYKALAIARAGGVGVEATALWAGNTAKEGMLHDVSKVLTPEHLAKSYGATVLMIVGLKGFGALGQTVGPKAAAGLGLVTKGGTQLTKGGKALVWGIGHGSGLSGMIATSHLNQGLGLTPKPIGGWKEGLVHDVFGYVQFAVAHKMADKVFGGKLSTIGNQQHTEIKIREASLLAKRWADRIGFGYVRNAQGEIIRDAKGYPVETADRRILVGLLMEASLNKPGFSGEKLTKLIKGGKVEKANAYLKKFELPLQLGEKGELFAVMGGEKSPHVEAGVVPPAKVEEEAIPLRDEDILEITDAQPKKEGVFAPFFEEAKAEEVTKPFVPPAKEPKKSDRPVEEEIPFLSDAEFQLVVEEGTPTREENTRVDRAPHAYARKTAALKVEPLEALDKVDPAARLGDLKGVKTAELISADGRALPVNFAEGDVITLGSREGLVEAQIGTTGSEGRQAEIQVILNSRGRLTYKLVPVAGNEVLIFDAISGRRSKVEKSGHALSAGELILLGESATLWNPPGSKQTPFDIAAGVYPKYFEEVVYPERLEATRAETVVLSKQVETLNATDVPITEGWMSSNVHMTLPNQVHTPVYGRWKYFSSSELIAKFALQGSPKQLPIAEYAVQIKGEQKLQDTVARLKALYGERLEVVTPLENNQAQFLLKGKEAGEGLIQIVLKGEPLKTPSVEAVRDAHQAFKENDYPILKAWIHAKDAQRSNYALRVLEMVDGGKRLKSLLETSQGAKTPAELARAGEELARVLTFLRDVPQIRQEMELMHRAELFRNESDFQGAMVWSKVLGKEKAEAAWKSYTDLTEQTDQLQVLGQDLRRSVPFPQQKPGNELFDKYSRMRTELEKSLTDLSSLVEAYRASEGYQKFPISETETSTVVKKPELRIPDMTAEAVLIEEGTQPGTPKAKVKKVAGGSDQGGPDMRFFRQGELAVLGALGVKTDLLAQPEHPDFGQALYDGLTFLLAKPSTASHYETAIPRLVGALRHQAHHQQGAWTPWAATDLPAFLAGYGRDAGGMLKAPLTGAEQVYLKDLGVSAITPENVLAIVYAVRSRSQSGKAAGRPDLQFFPDTVGLVILKKSKEHYGEVLREKDPNFYSLLEGLEPKAKVTKPPMVAGQGEASKDPARRVAAEKLPETFEIVANQGPGRDLASFVTGQNLLTEGLKIPGMSLERIKVLETAFERGGMVHDWKDERGIWFLDRPSGAQTMSTKKGSPADLKFYELWKSKRSFYPVDLATAQQSWEQLQTRARSLGISITFDNHSGRAELDSARLQSSLEAHGPSIFYLNELLSLLPDSMLKNLYLREIRLNSARIGSAYLSGYQDKTVYLYSGAMQGSRRYLAGLVFHELGHSTAERYMVGAGEVEARGKNIVAVDAVAAGDPSIPAAIRKKMQASHDILVKGQAMLGLEWGGGAGYRAKYQADYAEFLAEFHLLYVAAGPKLREHIAAFPEGSPERKAWEFVYHEIKERIFEGREYDYDRELAEVTQPILKLIPGGKAEPKPAATPVLAAAIADNQPNQPRRGTFSKNQPGEKYGSVSVHTDEGVGYKERNEDGFVQGENWALVLDGMGGHASGDKASQIAGERFQEGMGKGESLAQGMLAASDAINASKFKKGGAVAVAHRIVQNPDGSFAAEIVHVGDAGAIVFRPQANGEFELVFRTQEHSLAAELRKRGEYKNTLIMRGSDFANVVTTTLGAERSDTPEINRIPLRKGDWMLMFSDGIGDNFSASELSAMLKGCKTPEDAQQRIVAAAHLKMQRLKLAKDLMKGRTNQGGGLFELQTVEDGTLVVVQLESFPGFFIDPGQPGRSGEADRPGGKVYTADGVYVDRYKSDNLTIHVYRHDVASKPATLSPDATTQKIEIPQTYPKVDVSKLVNLSPSGEWSFSKDAIEVVIGRNEADGAQVVLPNLAVSRRHAIIQSNQGEFWLRDLGSVQGTSLNGRPLKKGEALQLDSGDLIGIAKKQFFTVDYGTKGIIRLIPAFHLPHGVGEMHAAPGVTLQRFPTGVVGISYEGKGELLISGTKLPKDGHFHRIRNGETVQIGDQVYRFRD